MRFISFQQVFNMVDLITKEIMDWKLREGDVKQQFQMMFKLGLNSDVTIRHKFNGEKKDYKVHSFVLTMASPVFEALFENSNFDSTTIVINDVKLETMDLFLKFIYQYELRLYSSEDAWSLYYLGEKYMMGRLKRTCLDWIKSNRNIDNICTNYEMARLFSLPEIPEYWKDLIDKLGCTLKNENFLCLRENSLLELLDESHLPVSEYKLFLGVAKWIKHNIKGENGEKSTFDHLKNMKDKASNELRINNEENHVFPKRFEVEENEVETEKTCVEIGVQTSERPEIISEILSKICFIDMTLDEFLDVIQTDLLTIEESLHILMKLVGDDNGVEISSWPLNFQNLSRNYR